jgi:general stress protein 26
MAMSEATKRDAIEFARALGTSHLATVEGDAPIVRVMHAFRVDDDLSIWYACGASSNKVRQIRANPNVAVSFYEAAQDLVVSGTAQIVKDAETKAEVWQDDWQRFFPQGKDDPEYCVLRITATKALYRNAEKHGFESQEVL